VPPPHTRHGYLAVGERLVHYVARGRGPAVVLVHASPADSRTLAPLVDGLAADFCALALDTPGHGLSDPLAAAEPEIDDYATALLETLSALKLDRVHLYGTHTGAKIALSAALRAPGQVASLTLDGVGISTPEERADQLARYTITWPPRSDGSHLVQAWHQARNMFLFWPWYAEHPGHVLHDAMPPVEDLHTIAHGMVLAGDRYPLAYRAAFRFDPTPALARLTVPTTIVAAPDDPLRGHLARLAPLPPAVRIDATATDLAARLAVVRAHLAAPGGASSADADALPATPGSRRQFAATALGDVHVSLGDPAPADTVVVAPLGARAAPPEGERALVLELPGTGRSTLTEPSRLRIDTLAESLATACAAAGAQPRLVRSSGSTAAVGSALAQALGVRSELTGPAGRLGAGDLPDLQPRADGGHLLAAWHLVRDAAIAHLSRHGRWPGAPGDAPDLHLLQERALGLAGSWQTLPAVHAACGGDAMPAAAGEPGQWDPLARPMRSPGRRS
jgi:pimeloyl-ACP methyl ester carboxylesterase